MNYLEFYADNYLIFFIAVVLFVFWPINQWIGRKLIHGEMVEITEIEPQNWEELEDKHHKFRRIRLKVSKISRALQTAFIAWVSVCIGHVIYFNYGNYGLPEMLLALAYAGIITWSWNSLRFYRSEYRAAKHGRDPYGHLGEYRDLLMEIKQKAGENADSKSDIEKCEFGKMSTRLTRTKDGFAADGIQTTGKNIFLIGKEKNQGDKVLVGHVSDDREQYCLYDYSREADSTRLVVFNYENGRPEKLIELLNNIGKTEEKGMVLGDVNGETTLMFPNMPTEGSVRIGKYTEAEVEK